MIDLRHAFGFSREPFPQQVPITDLYPLPGLKAFNDRFTYALELGLITLITGEVGSGKSTSLRAVTSALHPEQYRVVPVIGTSGTLLDLLRQISLELGAPASASRALLFKTIRELLLQIRHRKQTPVLIVDEAHLLRLEVFSQLHALTQFEFDAHSLMPMVFSGQNTLLDQLLFHTSRPLASRVIGRTHLEALQFKHMSAYLLHHLQLAGGSQTLLHEQAIVAIHQGSGGLLRRANHLARGALLAAASSSAPAVTPDHVRLAATEIL